jgi:putative transposase
MAMVSPRLQIGRYSEIAQVYAVTTVTLGRARLFAKPENAAVIIDAVRFVEGTKRTCSLAWVVMPDHVHWMFQLRSGTLSACM